MRIFELRESFRSIQSKPQLNIILFMVFFLYLCSSSWAMSTNGPDIKHPMMKPAKFSKNTNCPNCGMIINMWARTRHSFSNSEGDHETCSIRCMADFNQKTGETPSNSKVAIYLMPEKMVPVQDAFYVVGSSAKGTMTMKSKIAFDTKNSAQNFIKQYGGEIMSFGKTNKIAAMEANKTRAKTQNNRMKKGKFVTPSDNDVCNNCGMSPAEYPNNRSQITTSKGEHLHFCSTKCMVNNKKDSDQKIKSSWVTVYTEGDYEHPKSLYYVVGSKVMGPMGPEAFPFRKKADAVEFTNKQGGKIVRWAQLTPEIFGGQMMMK